MIFGKSERIYKWRWSYNSGCHEMWSIGGYMKYIIFYILYLLSFKCISFNLNKSNYFINFEISMYGLVSRINTSAIKIFISQIQKVLKLLMNSCRSDYGHLFDINRLRLNCSSMRPAALGSKVKKNLKCAPWGPSRNEPQSREIYCFGKPIHNQFLAGFHEDIIVTNLMQLRVIHIYGTSRFKSTF